MIHDPGTQCSNKNIIFVGSEIARLRLLLVILTLGDTDIYTLNADPEHKQHCNQQTQCWL